MARTLPQRSTGFHIAFMKMKMAAIIPRMPRQLLVSRVPVELSILEFDLDDRTELFLTYTWERKEGPPIARTGEDVPAMDIIGGLPGQQTSHPYGLRLGT